MVEFLKISNRYDAPFDIRDLRTHGFAPANVGQFVFPFVTTDPVFLWPNAIDLTYPGFRSQCGFIISCTLSILFDFNPYGTYDWGIIQNSSLIMPSYIIAVNPAGVSVASCNAFTFDVFTPATEWRLGIQPCINWLNQSVIIAGYFTYLPYKAYLHSSKL